MSAQNPQLIDMVNDIGIKLRGKIPGTQSRPTKAEIIQAINDAQDSICGEKSEYSFLNKTGYVNGWIPGVGISANRLGNTTVIPASISPSATNYGNTEYIAELYTVPSQIVQIIKEIDIPILGLDNGFGQLNGTFNCYVVAMSNLDLTSPTSDPNMPNGVPDMNNIIATATPIIVNDSVTNSPSTQGEKIITGNEYILQFLFDQTQAIANGQQVFVVMSWTTASNNSGSFKWYQSTAFTGQSYLWGNGNYPVIYFTQPNNVGSWSMVFISQNAVFASSPIGILTIGGLVDYAGTNVYNRPVDLPADCRIAQRIYNPKYALYLNPFPYDAYQYRPMQQPGNTFVVCGEDNTNSNGTLQAILFPSVSYVLNYMIDYVASPTQLVNDTDISIIPKQFRAILKCKAIMQLCALNEGLNVDITQFEADYVRLLSKLNETYLPYEDIAVSVNIGGLTDNNAPARDYQNNTNVLNEYPNGWYENKAGNGRQGGGY